MVVFIYSFKLDFQDWLLLHNTNVYKHLLVLQGIIFQIYRHDGSIF
jgi:hypothetical protein